MKQSSVLTIIGVLITVTVFNIYHFEQPDTNKKYSNDTKLTVKVYAPSEAQIAAKDSRLNIFVDGEIDINSGKVFSSVLRNYSIEKLYQANVYLNSPGGSVVAGLEIGEIIRHYKMNTYVGYLNQKIIIPGQCYSACAYVFLGGEKRYVDSTGSKLGVHQFSGGSSPETAQRVSAEIVSYITNMGVDPRLFKLMASAKSNEMRILTTSELTSYNIATIVNQMPVLSTKIVGNITQQICVNQWTSVNDRIKLSNGQTVVVLNILGYDNSVCTDKNFTIKAIASK